MRNKDVKITPESERIVRRISKDPIGISINLFFRNKFGYRLFDLENKLVRYSMYKKYINCKHSFNNKYDELYLELEGN